MTIQLSDHFDYKRLIRFTLPSIGMVLFTSIYGLVDGFFVSNYVGKVAFASVNLIIPFLQILGGMGAMLGVGGSALVAMTLGEGDRQRASRYFTMMIRLMCLVGVFCSVVGIVFMEPVARLFGATDAMLTECVSYGRVCLIFNTALLAQYTFQSYLMVAERPHLGFLVTVAAGLANMLLDFLFIAIFRWGVVGAALATGLSQCVGGIIPLVWFLTKKNDSALHFTKTGFEGRVIARACGNGASEMLASVSGSITGILYNLQLIRYAGEDGVAAYGVVMYAAFIFIAVFAGYASGSAPIMGYHYGAQNHAEMKNVLHRSLHLLAGTAVVLTAAAMLFARAIASLFVGYDADLLNMTARAFVICAIPFLVMWLNLYASSFFTALNNGAVSALISFVRALLLPVICITVMPMVWKLDGVWFALVTSEVSSAAVSLAFILGMKGRYGY